MAARLGGESFAPPQPPILARFGGRAIPPDPAGNTPSSVHTTPYVPVASRAACQKNTPSPPQKTPLDLSRRTLAAPSVRPVPPGRTAVRIPPALPPTRPHTGACAPAVIRRGSTAAPRSPGPLRNPIGAQIHAAPHCIRWPDSDWLRRPRPKPAPRL